MNSAMQCIDQCWEHSPNDKLRDYPGRLGAFYHFILSCSARMSSSAARRSQLSAIFASITDVLGYKCALSAHC